MNAFILMIFSVFLSYYFLIGSETPKTEYLEIILPFKGEQNITFFGLFGLNFRILCGSDRRYSLNVNYFFNDSMINSNDSNFQIVQDSLIIMNASRNVMGYYTCKSDIYSSILPPLATFSLFSLPVNLWFTDPNIYIVLEHAIEKPVFGGNDRFEVQVNGEDIPINQLRFDWNTSVYIPQLDALGSLDTANLAQASLIKLPNRVIHAYYLYFPFNIHVVATLIDHYVSNQLTISPLKEESQCALIYSQADAQVVEGDTLILECLTNKIPQNITWLYQGTNIELDNNSFNIGMSAIVIKSFNATRIGKYTCIISCDGVNLSSSAFITLAASNGSSENKNAIMNISAVNISNPVIKEGETFSMMVSLQNQCAFSNFKNGALFGVSETNSRNHTLLLQNASLSDTGFYQIRIDCGGQTFCLISPLLVGETFYQDSNLISVKEGVKPSYYVISWVIPYFISQLSNFNCLIIESDKIKNENCYDTVQYPQNELTIDLPYRDMISMSLISINYDSTKYNISHIFYKTGYPPINVTESDFRIYDISWAISNDHWEINWKIATELPKGLVAYRVSCKKYNGKADSVGITYIPEFHCGRLGTGVNSAEITLLYDGTKILTRVYKNNMFSREPLSIRWTVIENSIQIIWKNVPTDRSLRMLPLLLLLQELDCERDCTIFSQILYSMTTSTLTITDLKHSSSYRLYYMRSDVENIDTNPYIYFYTPPEGNKSNQLPIWLFVISLIPTVTMLLLLIVFRFRRVPHMTTSDNEGTNNTTNQDDFVFNIDSLPSPRVNFSENLPSLRETTNGKEFGLLINDHSERCIMKVLTSLPNISFKTRLLQRCEILNYSAPLYTNESSKFGYKSVVTTHEIRIGSRDYFSSEIEAEHSAARNALIELKELSRDINLLLPEFLYRLLLPHNAQFYSYRNTLHLLCIDTECELPSIKVCLTNRGCECKINIGTDFVYGRIYDSTDTYLCTENLCFDVLMKLQILASKSSFNPSDIHYPPEITNINNHYFSTLSSYLMARRWIYVRMKYDSTPHGYGMGKIQICKRQFMFKILAYQIKTAKEKMAFRTLQYLGLTAIDLEDM